MAACRVGEDLATCLPQQIPKDPPPFGEPGPPPGSCRRTDTVSSAGSAALIAAANCTGDSYRDVPSRRRLAKVCPYRVSVSSVLLSFTLTSCCRMHDVDMVARLDFTSGIVCARNKFAIAGYGEWSWRSERH